MTPAQGSADGTAHLMAAARTAASGLGLPHDLAVLHDEIDAP